VLKASTAEDGHFEKRLAVLKVGDVFGEMELIDMQRRSATVRALEPVSALALSNGDLFLIYESDLPTFTLIVLNLARELSRRLRTLDDLAVHYMAITPVSRAVVSAAAAQEEPFSRSCHARMAMARRPDMVMYSP
jgi:CRP-like cAMP-binding protein